MPHTLRAQVWIDLVNLYALVYRLVGTFGLANIAVDAFFSDFKSQSERALVSKLHFQCGLDICTNKLRYIPTQARHFPDQRG